HNCKKKDAASITEADKAYERKLVLEGYALLNNLLKRYAEDEKISEETFLLSKKLLRLNPEISTLWNIRRKFILALPEFASLIESKVNIDKTCIFHEVNKRQHAESLGQSAFLGEVLENKEDSSPLQEVKESTPSCNIYTVSHPAAGNDPESESNSMIPQMEQKKESNLDGRLQASQKDTTAVSSHASSPTGDDLISSKNSQKESLMNELKLTEEALRKLPKGFCIWYHRLWTLRQLINQSYAGLELLKQERSLCSMFLKVDARNFHCWQHRSFICAMMKTLSKTHVPSASCESPGKETDASVEEVNQLFSQSLIHSNFSNYSAWYLRSTLPTESVDVSSERLWLREGLFTEPEDQSLWKYYQWLLFTRGCETPRLLKCVAASSLRTVYFFFLEAYSLLSSSSFATFYDGLHTFDIQGTWEPIVSQIFHRYNGRNSRIKGIKSDFSYVWRFQVTHIRLASPQHLPMRNQKLAEIQSNNQMPHFYFVIPIGMHGMMTHTSHSQYLEEEEEEEEEDPLAYVKPMPVEAAGMPLRTSCKNSSTHAIAAASPKTRDLHVHAFPPPEWQGEAFHKNAFTPEDTASFAHTALASFKAIKFDCRQLTPETAFQMVYSYSLEANVAVLGGGGRHPSPVALDGQVDPLGASPTTPSSLTSNSFYVNGYPPSSSWKTADTASPEYATMKTIGKGVNLDILKDELHMVEALAELEPSCKYVWLTRCQILEVLSPLDPNIEAYYEKLAAIDSGRKHYYNDCRMAVRLIQRVQHVLKAQQSSICIEETQDRLQEVQPMLDLRALQLRKIAYPSLLEAIPTCLGLDLSNNLLNNRLDLSNNPLEAIALHTMKKTLRLSIPRISVEVGCDVAITEGVAKKEEKSENREPPAVLLLMRSNDVDELDDWPKQT
ncbi:hypothetical protein IE077_003644, partial [Cardiosporidium cionae]